MNYWYVAAGLALLFVTFIVWRLLSVPLGMRRRDEKLLRALEPIAEWLLKNEPVTKEEVYALARLPQYRYLLHRMLSHLERLDLFPAEFLSIAAQGEGLLAYWMMHPNELQEAPSEIELVEAVERQRDGESARFLVYRYRMPAGHWAEKDGWLLGVAGPFIENDVPYSDRPGAFSRCGDKVGDIEPSALVDWYVGIRKGD